MTWINRATFKKRTVERRVKLANNFRSSIDYSSKIFFFKVKKNQNEKKKSFDSKKYLTHEGLSVIN